MKGNTAIATIGALVIMVGAGIPTLAAETFRVATYNLENYLETEIKGRPAKSPESKTQVRHSILALKPDVLVLQELGGADSLMELRDSLKGEGLNLEFWHLVSASDTNIHLGLLSRFPIKAARDHTNESFLLNGRRFHVSRGFAEVDIEVSPSYSFTLIGAHLKSKRTYAEADEAELRLEEARLLREVIDTRLTNAPNLNLVVLGDFNDTKDSAPARLVVGRGKTKLVDTRPAERKDGEDATGERILEGRSITWTHYYSKEDTYRRIDFLLISRGMAREWLPEETYVLAARDWGLASDHRPIVAGFEAMEK